jgi:hypothetical protein
MEAMKASIRFHLACCTRTGEKRRIHVPLNKKDAYIYSY